jgi:hypothetical protein
MEILFQLQLLQKCPVNLRLLNVRGLLVNSISLQQPYIGVFDERFFMYPEDMDLSRRVAQGSQVSFFPDFVIIHKYGGTTRKSLSMFVIRTFNGGLTPAMAEVMFEDSLLTCDQV